MTRKLFLQINVTLDGYIEDHSGDIDWHFADAEFDRFINDTLRSIDGMVFGRVAFEKLAGYWPTAGETAATDIERDTARLMNELPKYVVSQSLDRTDWHNSHVVSGDVRATVEELKGRPGSDLALFAGARTAMSLLRFGLVDELRLIVNPILQGSGTRLFDGAYDAKQLSLSDVRRFASGALLLTYRPTSVSEGRGHER